MMNVIIELIKFNLLKYRRNSTGSITKTPVAHKYTNTYLQMIMMIIVIIIDLFHLPTLMHNSLFINIMYVTL